MNLLHGVGDFFSLDIGTNSMRIVQLSGSGQHGWTLQKYAYVPITQQLTQDSSDLGKKRLGEAILGASIRLVSKPRTLLSVFLLAKLLPLLLRRRPYPKRNLPSLSSMKSTNMFRWP